VTRAVPGATKFEQAVRVAGALAECGAREVVLTEHGRDRRLATRETDLPGVLMGAEAGSVLEAPTCGIHIEIQEAGLRWSVADAQLARTFADAIG
jgi:hypothetical protein